MQTRIRGSKAVVEAGDQSADAEPTLAALNDATCRQILALTESAPHTVREITEACDIPSSTAYRKIDLLTEASLVEERTRIRTDGNHVSEYVCAVSSVTLGLSEEGFDVTLDRPEALS